VLYTTLLQYGVGVVFYSFLVGRLAMPNFRWIKDGLTPSFYRGGGLAYVRLTFKNLKI